MLTAAQLNILRTDLQELAGIEYDDVLNELLDHYALLTEQRMRADHSFEEASRRAWLELGGGRGILHIQKRYKKLLLDQIRIQQWLIVVRYFRWPTLIPVTLLGLLTYLAASVLPPVAMPFFFLIVVFTPYLLFIPSGLRMFWRNQIRKQSVPASLRREVIYRQARYGNYLYLAVIQLPMLVTSCFPDGKRWSANHPYLFEWHTGLSAALGFIAIIYTLTYFELYTKHFTQRFTNA